MPQINARVWTNDEMMIQINKVCYFTQFKKLCDKPKVRFGKQQEKTFKTFLSLKTFKRYNLHFNL